MNPLVRSSTLSPFIRCPTKAITNLHFAHFSFTKRRNIATSTSRHSYVGSTPIPVPPGITLERVILSKSGSTSSTTEASSSRRKDKSSSEERLIIRGAKGETSIKLYNFMRFLLPNATPGEQTPPGSTQDGVRELKVKRRNPPCPPTAIADTFSFTPAPVLTAAPTASDAAQVTLFVESPTEKQQRMVWGLTRTLIANAIAGQSDGYTLPIYLIGVGYRAALEVDHPSAAASASNTPHPSKSTTTSTPTPPASTVVTTPVGSTTTHETYPRRRLVMRLGYSHVIYVPVPPDLRVTVQSPTIIFVWGRDKQRVGQFCADVRALRKPEVYKGKGVFVGDEKIKMKVGKKK